MPKPGQPQQLRHARWRRLHFSLVAESSRCIAWMRKGVYAPLPPPANQVGQIRDEVGATRKPYCYQRHSWHANFMPGNRDCGLYTSARAQAENKTFGISESQRASVVFASRVPAHASLVDVITNLSKRDVGPRRGQSTGSGRFAAMSSRRARAHSPRQSRCARIPGAHTIP